VGTGWLIRAGGAHSVTRASMADALEGGTYRAPRWQPTCASAAACHETARTWPAGPEGYLLLAPLPDERWITFVGDLDDAEAQRVATATASGAVGGDRPPRPRRGRRGRCGVGGALPHAPPRGLASGARTALPARRRWPPAEPLRWRGPELRASGRPRHRLEACARAARPGPRHAQRNGASCPALRRKRRRPAARLARRWDGLVDVRAAGDPRAAGLSTPGAILMRPDGHVGSGAAPADAEAWPRSTRTPTPTSYPPEDRPARSPAKTIPSCYRFPSQTALSDYIPCSRRQRTISDTPARRGCESRHSGCQTSSEARRRTLLAAGPRRWVVHASNEHAWPQGAGANSLGAWSCTVSRL
jgi:hypothetical protein